MNRTSHTPTIRRSATLIGIALGAVAVLGGCTQVSQSLTDVWAINYRVTLAGPDASHAAGIDYLAAPKRGAQAETVTAMPAEAVATPKGAWGEDVMINAGDIARITVTPQPGDIANCAILSDNNLELITQTGEPGATVTCEIKTAEFAKK